VVLRSALGGTVGRCKPGTGKIRSREVPGLHDPEDGGITILRNAKDCSSSDTASRPGTVRSSVKLAGIPTKPTRVGTLIEATIYLQLIQNRYMFRSFTVLQCSHQHYVQPVVSDVEVVGYL